MKNIILKGLEASISKEEGKVKGWFTGEKSQLCFPARA